MSDSGKSLDFRATLQQNRGVKLYQFDGVDAELRLLPLAARRVLDVMGRKLSLDGFKSLPLDQRRALTEAGSGEGVDCALAEQALTGAVPPARELQPMDEPSEHTVPEHVVSQLGPGRPLPLALWRGLTPLDRYCLDKVCRRKSAERLEAAYREIVGHQMVSTHVRPQGGVHMVSVSHKEPSHRVATAECWISMSRAAFDRLLAADGPKGDVLGTARVAGIMATKRTGELIPLCHPLFIEHVDLELEPDHQEARLRVLCTVQVFARTGVEMEAMVGANVAALTVYDMLKSIDRGMLVGPCRLLHKSGGKSGTFAVKAQLDEPTVHSTEGAPR